MPQKHQCRGLEVITGLELARMPSGLVDRVMAYGKEFAVQVLDQKRYDLFDPMLSDRSCQLRAIWLACFWKRKKTAEALLDEDLFIFGLAGFLSEMAIRFEHPITGDSSLKTKPLTRDQDMFQLKNTRERQRFLGVAKALLAERVLRDLEKWFLQARSSELVLRGFSCNPVEIYLETLRLMADPEAVSYSCVRVPVVHFFTGFLVLIALAVHFKIDLVAIMRRVERNEDGYLVVPDLATHRFCYDPVLNDFVEPTTELESSEGPTVVFSGHSYLEGERQIAPETMVRSLNAACLEEASFVDYIYGIMATHESVPGDGCDLAALEEVAPLTTKMIRQYRQFAQKTNVRSFETGSMLYNAIQTNRLRGMELPTVAYEITHIYNG